MQTCDKPAASLIGSPPPPEGARLPNFIVIGAMKSSTTAFYELFSRHPSVWFSQEKEPHYFTAKDYGQAEAWQAYLDLFAAADASRSILAEASTGYSKLPLLGPTPQRIKADLGDPKLLFILRDPVARTVSNYRHSYSYGAYPQGTTLGQAIDLDPIIVQASRYALQIKAYREVFGDEALLIVTSDELQAKPAAVMRSVERHLQLKPYDGWPNELPSANAAADLARTARLRTAGGSRLVDTVKTLLPDAVKSRVKAMIPPAPPPPEIDPADKALILEQVGDDLTELIEMLGDRVSAWPSVSELAARKA